MSITLAGADFNSDKLHLSKEINLQNSDSIGEIHTAKVVWPRQHVVHGYFCLLPPKSERWLGLLHRRPESSWYDETGLSSVKQARTLVDLLHVTRDDGFHPRGPMRLQDVSYVCVVPTPLTPPKPKMSRITK